MSMGGEVLLELLLLDGSNYAYWSVSVLSVLRTMGPQIEWIVDVSISPPNVDWSNLTKEEEKCLQLNAQATNILIHALSKDVLDFIMNDEDDDDIPKDAHLIWTTLKERYAKSKYDDKEHILEKSSEGFSTSSTINEKPQVFFSNCQDDVFTSTSSPTYELIQGNEMVSRLNDHSCHTSTSSCACRTKILKEEEVYGCNHPSEESTSSPHTTSIDETDVCLMAQDKKNQQEKMNLS